MKILTLNTWGGRAGHKGLLDFFKSQNSVVDVFCLQEVWSAPYEQFEGVSAGGMAINHDRVLTEGLQQIAEILSEYEYFFHPSFLNNYGLLMLVHKRIQVRGSGDIWVHEDKHFMPEGDIGHHARNLQYVHISDNGTPYTVCNFHGLWNGQGKGDSEARLAQSDKIIEFGKQHQNLVLCGDFNLLPNTESIAKLENAGLRNLVREYGITSTRTSFYKKPEKFADYIFVSSGAQVTDFKVLPDEVSDHAPLLLEISS